MDNPEKITNTFYFNNHGISGFLETVMNRSGSLSNNENHTLYDRPPPPGPLRRTAAGSFFSYRSAAQEAQSGAAEFITPDE